MKKFYQILTWGLLAILISCSDEAKQATEPEGVKAYTQFYANIVDEMAETRSTLLNDKKIAFEVGDAIQLYVDKDLKTGTFYTLKYQSSSKTFDVDPGYTPISGKQFNAIFPAGAGFNATDNRYVFYLAPDIDYRHDSFATAQMMPMWGDGKGTNVLSFYHMTGLIRFTLSGSLKVTKLTLKGNNGEQIAGGAEIDPTKARPVLDMVSRYPTLPPSYEQVMTVKDVTLTETPISFYFVVPAITFEKGITLTVEAEGFHHPIVKSTTNAVKVGRGVMKSFAVVDTDAILQVEADEQLDALIALYNSLDGPNWKHKKWDVSKPLSDADAWPGVTADAHGTVTKIDLSGCGLKGKIPAEIGLLKSVSELNLSDNSITGGIPKEVRNMTSLTSFDVSNNQMNDSVPYVVYTSDLWAHVNKSLDQSGGNALKTKYVSNNYAKHEELKVLQKHSEGGGIPIVITCDAFSDNMYDDFTTLATQAMEDFFSIPPFSDFRGYFDVYRLMAVSPNNEPNLNVYYGTKRTVDSYSIDSWKVREVLENLGALGNTSSNVLSIVLINEPKDKPNRALCYKAVDGFAAALIPVDEDMEQVIHHEAGGHGFGMLADEYSSDGSKTFKNKVSTDSNGDPIDLDDLHAKGFDLNVDYKNTSTTAVWKDFWTDDAYASEGVGAYSGGMAIYSNGVYHSTKKSVMNNHKEYDKFNPISRYAIVLQIAKRAGYAQPTVEWFKNYDKKNIAYQPAVSVLTRNYVEKNEVVLGAPPVWIE